MKVEELRYTCRKVSFWAALALIGLSIYAFSAQFDMAWEGIRATSDGLALAREFGAPLSRRLAVYWDHRALYLVPLYSLACFIYSVTLVVMSFRRSVHRRWFSLFFSIVLLVLGWMIRPSFLGQLVHQLMMIPLYVLIAVWVLDFIAVSVERPHRRHRPKALPGEGEVLPENPPPASLPIDHPSHREPLPMDRPPECKNPPRPGKEGK